MYNFVAQQIFFCIVGNQAEAKLVYKHNQQQEIQLFWKEIGWKIAKLSQYIKKRNHGDQTGEQYSRMGRIKTTKAQTRVETSEVWNPFRRTAHLM